MMSQISKKKGEKFISIDDSDQGSSGIDNTLMTSVRKRQHKIEFVENDGPSALKKCKSECYDHEKYVSEAISASIRTIESSSITPEKVNESIEATSILSPYYDDIVKNLLGQPDIVLCSFAGVCFEKKLIDRETKNFVIRCKGEPGVNLLFLILEMKIQYDKRCALLLTQAMKELEALKDIADVILSQNHLDKLPAPVADGHAVTHHVYTAAAHCLNCFHNRICLAIVTTDCLVKVATFMYQETVIDKLAKTDIISKGGYEGASSLLDSLVLKCIESKSYWLPVRKILEKYELLPLNIIDKICTDEACSAEHSTSHHKWLGSNSDISELVDDSSLTPHVSDSSLFVMTQNAYSMSLIDRSTKNKVLELKGTYGSQVLVQALSRKATNDPDVLKLLNENFLALKQQLRMMRTDNQSLPESEQHDEVFKEVEENFNSQGLISRTSANWASPSLLQQFTEKEASLVQYMAYTNFHGNELAIPEASEMSKILDEILDEDSASEFEVESIKRSLPLIHPTGSLTRPIYQKLYSTLFKMAWNGREYTAHQIVRRMKRQSNIPVDLKIISMEVTHTVNTERDFKVLTSALAYTDLAECKNRHLLKCRIHRRIAGIHYRNGDVDEAEDHIKTALQLAEQLAPDIDTVYTNRLEALILFEQYKSTNDDAARKGAEKYFERAMDHAERQPEWKRFVTERVKISKAHFHLDMVAHMTMIHSNSDQTLSLQRNLMKLTESTLRQVDETYLTDADRAFFYLAKSKFYLRLRNNLPEAKTLATKALALNEKCSLATRANESQSLIHEIENKM